MDKETREFLEEINGGIHKLYAPDKSAEFLNKFPVHLKMYYNDIRAELKDKEEETLMKIDGKYLLFLI